MAMEVIGRSEGIKTISDEDQSRMFYASRSYLSFIYISSWMLACAAWGRCALHRWPSYSAQRSAILRDLLFSTLTLPLEPFLCLP